MAKIFTWLIIGEVVLLIVLKINKIRKKRLENKKEIIN